MVFGGGHIKILNVLLKLATRGCKGCPCKEWCTVITNEEEST
jgi:hypothetical protein